MLKLGRFVRISAIQLLMAGLFLSSATAHGTKDSPKATIADAPSRYAKLDGARVHYKSFGKGSSAIVFIHGWTCNLNFWRLQVPDFASSARVIAIDLPGHGQSDKPQVTYSMDLFARAIDAVLQDAKVDKAVLVGHSMGTPVIRQFYRKYPQKTLAMVVVDGPLRAFGKKEDSERFIAPLRGPGYKELENTMIDGMFGPSASKELRDEIKTPMLSTPQHVAVGAMEGLIDPAIWGEDKINVPTLAVMTKNWPRDTEQFYRNLAPKLEYHTMDGAGHFLMMEKPREFNEMLAAFLMKNGLRKK